MSMVDFVWYNLFPNSLLDIYIDNHSMYPNRCHYFDRVLPNRTIPVIDRIRLCTISDKNNDENPEQCRYIFRRLNKAMIDRIEHRWHRFYLEIRTDIDKQMKYLD